MDFELRLLRHARALAEEGSFARAARTLRLTQPALSRSIQELERRTGIKLFDRNQGQIEPTNLGRVFLARARELLGHAEALDREVSTMRGSGTGSLVVGSGTFPTEIFMGAAAGAFLGRNPDVGVRLVNDNWIALIAALRRRELDFVVAAPPVEEESNGLEVTRLSLRQGYFLVRPGHPLLSRPALALADVVACPIACAGQLPATITEVLLEARGGRGAGRPVPDVACDSHEMMRRIVATTDHLMLSTLAANARRSRPASSSRSRSSIRRLATTFAVLRLEGRTLPPIADEFIRTWSRPIARRSSPSASSPHACSSLPTRAIVPASEARRGRSPRRRAEAPPGQRDTARRAALSPAPTMDDAQLLRYSRHLLLNELGPDAQERFAAAHALVVGVGGLGNPAAQFLASAGVGPITLVDADSVDLTNLQRQILFALATSARRRSRPPRAASRAINPEPDFVRVAQRVGPASSRALVADADVVLDCTDNFATRHAINRACVAARKPLVSGAAIRFDGQLAVFDARDPASPCYHCLFGEGEELEETRCATMGVFAPLVGIVGAMQAAEALKLLAQVGTSLAGRLLLVDALAASGAS